MWFQKAMMEMDGQRIMLVADLDGERIYPSLFFAHFNTAPIFNTYDLVLDTMVVETITTSDLIDGLFRGGDKFQEEFSTA